MLPDLVEDGKRILSRPRSPGLASAIGLLLADPVMAAEFGKRPGTLCAFYGSPRFAAETEKVHEEALHHLPYLDGEPGLRGGSAFSTWRRPSRARGHRNVVACRPRSPLAQAAGAMNLEILPLPFRGMGSLDRLAPALGGQGRPAAPPHAHTAHAQPWRPWPPSAPCRGSSTAGVDFPAGDFSRMLKYEPAGAVVGVSVSIAEVLRASGLRSHVEVVPDAYRPTPRDCGWAQIPAGPLRPGLPEERGRLRAELAARWARGPRGPFWVGNLAALVPHKDHDTLLAAALIVSEKASRRRFPDRRGEGPEEARLIAQIRRLNLEGKAFILGQVPIPPPC